MADDAPATSTESRPSPPPGKGQSAIALVVALVVVTVLGAAAGAGSAMFLSGSPAAHDEKPATHAAEKPGSTIVVRDLPPIVTNVASPGNVWMRLESSLVYDQAKVQDADLLMREISADILAFLRTLSLPQLNGASGLLHLKEDLSERVAIRSNGQIHELLIHSMVVQ